MLDLLGYIPEDGDKQLVECENIQFYIEEVSEKRIQLVRIVLENEEENMEQTEDE